VLGGPVGETRTAPLLEAIRRGTSHAEGGHRKLARALTAAFRLPVRILH
jgi:hypothetical protein